jgi:hypothetical protein
MPAELKTVHRSAHLGNAGEPSAIGNGATAVSLSNSGGRAPFLPLPSNLAHPFRIRQLEKEDTPSQVFWLKSPSAFGKSNPRSSDDSKYRFSFIYFYSFKPRSIYRNAISLFGL